MSGEQTREGESGKITVVMPQEVLRAVKRRARERGLVPSVLIRTVVMDWLAGEAQGQRRRPRKPRLASAARREEMRWVQDGTEYNVEDALAIADSGKDRYSDEPEYTLYKGSSSYEDEALSFDEANSEG